MQVRVHVHTHTHMCEHSQRDFPPPTPQSIFKTQPCMRKQSPFLSLSSNLLYQFWNWEVPDQSQQIWYLVRALFLVHRCLSSLCPHMTEGARELSGASFIRVLIPVMSAPPSWPNYPKVLSPSTITWVSTYKFFPWEFHKYCTLKYYFFLFLEDTNAIIFCLIFLFFYL